MYGMLTRPIKILQHVKQSIKIFSLNKCVFDVYIDLFQIFSSSAIIFNTFGFNINTDLVVTPNFCIQEYV